MRKLKWLVQHLVGLTGHTIVKKTDLRIGEDNKIEILPYLLDALQSTLGRRISFIQVGANDGVTQDPIHSFIGTYGWRGIRIEPQSALYEELVNNSAGFVNVECLNVAIGEKDGKATIHTLPNEPKCLGGTLFSGRRLQASVQIKEEVAMWSVEYLLCRYPQVTSPDVLVVDTEGYDAIIVNEFLDYLFEEPTLIQFEHILLGVDEYQSLCARLIKLGYKLIQCGQDTIASRINK